jgi:hypothetical protein
MDSTLDLVLFASLRVAPAKGTHSGMCLTEIGQPLELRAANN